MMCPAKVNVAMETRTAKLHVIENMSKELIGKYL